MAKEQKVETRVIYKKNEDLSKVGFTDFGEAKRKESELLVAYVEPQYRVRVRLRSRTNTWDVVVKVRTEVKAETKAAA